MAAGAAPPLHSQAAAVRYAAALPQLKMEKMTEEEFAKHKKYAGEAKPSMHRRRIGHDYQSRRMYLITMTIEGRKPLLGRLVGQVGETAESTTARVELTPLGQRVEEEWFAVKAHHPEASAIALQIMPDHLHGILFVEQAMEHHLGAVIRGFKTSTNKAYRQFFPEAAAPPLHSQPAALWRPAASPASAAVPPVGYAAAAPQPKRDRSHENRQHGLLWTPGYNDHILSNEGELNRWRHYLGDNPRRLFLRRHHPDLFRVSFGLQIGPFTCTAIGNRFLLDYPQRRQVQCSTHYYEEDIRKAVDGYMAAARDGAVLVSPAISEGEKRTMRTAFDAALPLVYVSANGFGAYSKPGGAFFDACAEGRLLILSPFPQQNQKVALTRRMCMQMNELARLIADGGNNPAGAAAPQPE